MAYASAARSQAVGFAAAWGDDDLLAEPMAAGMLGSCGDAELGRPPSILSRVAPTSPRRTPLGAQRAIATLLPTEVGDGRRVDDWRPPQASRSPWTAASNFTAAGLPLQDRSALRA